MKKNLFLMMFIVLSFYFTGCGSSGNSGNTNPPATEVRVDLIGTWQVTSRMTGNACEGLTAEMIETIESLDGDTNMLGTLTYDGENFTFDEDENGPTCELKHVSGTIELNRPNFMTEEEFKASEWDDLSSEEQETIARFDVINYTDEVISIEIEYLNGSVFYQTFNRI